MRDTPVLRRRALYQASLFASFTLFWTISPIILSEAPFNLTQKGIGFFALAAAVGVLVAPIAGRLADRGHTKITTLFSLAIGAAAFLLALFSGNSGSLPLLVVSAILLELGVQTNVVLGQRTIYLLGAEVRSRLNALYMAIFFAGGAIGSSVASVAYVYGGWSLVAWLGFAFPFLGLLFFFTE